MSIVVMGLSWLAVAAGPADAMLLRAALAVLVVLQAAAIAILLIQRQADRTHALSNVRDRRDITEASDFSQAVLSSVGADVAVLDGRGVVLITNTSWADAVGAGENPAIRAIPGTAFLDAIDLADAAKKRLESAVRSVLDGERPQAVIDYAWDGHSGRHWSEVRVQRLDRNEGGVVVTHLEITARKRAEAEVHRHLHELAHVNMMSGMGELAAAVSHELNQPLTAVLSNAQAARRMLMCESPALTDVREILDDIIEQDKRAGEVLQRIRRLLKKERFDWAPLDLNVLIRDVIRLLAGQAALGRVSVVSDLTPELPAVRGDRVQLQQVVLNLMLNAIQASTVSGTERPPMVLIVTRAERDTLRLRVRDSGPGITHNDFSRIFEPFYTTKPEGLGIGLSISRSIVELHKGQLVAANHAAGGAEFTVTLPLERTAS
jgi:two-component system, LuxR family, sensor kinase FixL